MRTSPRTDQPESTAEPPVRVGRAVRLQVRPARPREKARSRPRRRSRRRGEGRHRAVAPAVGPGRRRPRPGRLAGPRPPAPQEAARPERSGHLDAPSPVRPPSAAAAGRSARQAAASAAGRVTMLLLPVGMACLPRPTLPGRARRRRGRCSLRAGSSRVRGLPHAAGRRSAFGALDGRRYPEPRNPRYGKRGPLVDQRTPFQDLRRWRRRGHERDEERVRPTSRRNSGAPDLVPFRKTPRPAVGQAGGAGEVRTRGPGRCGRARSTA
jgi:hypothetical protein